MVAEFVTVTVPTKAGAAIENRLKPVAVVTFVTPDSVAVEVGTLMPFHTADAELAIVGDEVTESVVGTDAEPLRVSEVYEGVPLVSWIAVMSGSVTRAMASSPCKR